MTPSAHIVDIDLIVLDGIGQLGPSALQQLLAARLRDALALSDVATAPELAPRAPLIAAEIARVLSAASSRTAGQEGIMP